MYPITSEQIEEIVILARSGLCGVDIANRLTLTARQVMYQARKRGVSISLTARQRICANCGKDYVGTSRGKCCGADCMARHSLEMSRKRSLGAWNARTANIATCKVCGNTFAITALRRVFCSAECVKHGKKQAMREKTLRIGRTAYRRRRARLGYSEFRGSCMHCGGAFCQVSPRKRMRFCGIECRRKADKELRRERSRIKVLPTGIKKRCKRCDVEFVTYPYSGEAQKYCSKRCSARDQEHRRRAREKGALVELFSFIDIAERDTWDCKICGKPVNKEASVPHPHAPTLDHIIPLAKGGTHERANVQLAHFLCNSYKRDLLPTAE